MSDGDAVKWDRWRGVEMPADVSARVDGKERRVQSAILIMGIFRFINPQSRRVGDFVSCIVGAVRALLAGETG